MAIYSKKIIGSNAVGVDKSQYEISNPTNGQKGYNSRGQRVYYNGTKWTTRKPTSVAISRTKTNRDGSKTRIKYKKSGVDRTTYDKSGTKTGEKKNLTMEQHKAEGERTRLEQELKRLQEVGASGYIDDKGKIVVTDAEGNKYKADSIFSHGFGNPGDSTGGAGSTMWAELRRAFGLEPSKSNPWYAGDGRDVDAPLPTGPNLTYPDDGDEGGGGSGGGGGGGGSGGGGGGGGGIQDPGDGPRPEKKPPEFPDKPNPILMPVFGNHRDPKKLYDEWFNGPGSDLLRGYGPAGPWGPGNLGPRDFSMDREEYMQTYFPDGYDAGGGIPSGGGSGAQGSSSVELPVPGGGGGGAGNGGAGGGGENPNQPHSAGGEGGVGDFGPANDMPIERFRDPDGTYDLDDAIDKFLGSPEGPASGAKEWIMDNKGIINKVISGASFAIGGLGLGFILNKLGDWWINKQYEQGATLQNPADIPASEIEAALEEITAEATNEDIVEGQSPAGGRAIDNSESGYDGSHNNYYNWINGFDPLGSIGNTFGTGVTGVIEGAFPYAFTGIAGDDRYAKKTN